MGTKSFDPVEQFVGIDPKYCDYNATTPLPADLLKLVQPAYAEFWRNPSAQYESVDEERSLLRTLHNRLEGLASSDEFRSVICASATEANNLALSSTVKAADGAKVFVYSPVEHASVGAFIEAQGNNKKFISLKVNEFGQIDLKHLEQTVGAFGSPAVVVCQLANNETGVIHPIEDIRRLVGSETLLVVDGSQAVGKMTGWRGALRFCDYFVISPHKFYGPKGVGVLLARRGRPLSPQIRGGGQQHGYRSGTENLPVLFLTLGWLELLPELETAIVSVEPWRNQLEQGLVAAVSRVRILGVKAPRIPNVTSVYIPGCDGDALVAAMSRAGWSVSTGSACHANSLVPSHVALAYGLPWSAAREVVRISLGLGNSDGTAASLLQALTAAVETQRRAISNKRGHNEAESASPA